MPGIRLFKRDTCIWKHAGPQCVGVESLLYIIGQDKSDGAGWHYVAHLNHAHLDAFELRSNVQGALRGVLQQLLQASALALLLLHARDVAARGGLGSGEGHHVAALGRDQADISRNDLRVGGDGSGKRGRREKEDCNKVSVRYFCFKSPEMVTKDDQVLLHPSFL